MFFVWFYINVDDSNAAYTISAIVLPRSILFRYTQQYKSLIMQEDSIYSQTEVLSA